MVTSFLAHFVLSPTISIMSFNESETLGVESKMVADTDHVKCVKLRTDLSPLISPSSRRTDKETSSGRCGHK